MENPFRQPAFQALILAAKISAIPGPPRCQVCGSKTGLQQCVDCRVVSYCSGAHQSAHREKHEAACAAIRSSRENLEREEATLRAHPGDGLSRPDVFSNCVGDFWNVMHTRDYMRARFQAADSLLRINTAPAIEESLGHYTDMLRLCRRDNMGVRGIIPPLLLRLDREQECYDFLKWWGVLDNYPWGNMTAPYLDIRKANAFGSIDIFRSEEFKSSLGQLVSLTLLKLRLYLDLEASGGDDYDAEIDRPVGKLVRERLRSRNLNQGALGKLADSLKDQYGKLCLMVQEANPHFWPLLIDESFEAPAQTEEYTPGSIEEAYHTVYHCKKSWEESEDAILMVNSETAALTPVYKGSATAVVAATEELSIGPKEAEALERRRGIGEVLPRKSNYSPSELAYRFSPTAGDPGQADRYISRSDRRQVLVYTDGACSDNGQAGAQGGWAVVFGRRPTRDGGGARSPPCMASGRLEDKGPFGEACVPTSNRAELRAVIAALRLCDWRRDGFISIVIATDSAYVVDGATNWIKGWLRKDWTTSAGSAVKNRDLWEMLLGEVERWAERGLDVELCKIPRGLNGDADTVAKAASYGGQPLAAFQDIVIVPPGATTAAATTQSPRVVTGQSPRIVALCLDSEDMFLEIYRPLVLQIATKVDMERASTPASALALLDQEPPPTAILVTDAALTRQRKVLERVIDRLNEGSRVVLAGCFSSGVDEGQFNRLFATIGLPWKRGSYYRTTSKLHRDVVGDHLARQLSSAYSQKALYVTNVAKSATWYTADDDAEQASAVFAEVGSGMLGYVGDVNGEDPSAAVVLAMCGLLD